MKGRERIKIAVLVALVALVAAAGYGRLLQRGTPGSPGRDAVVPAPAPAVAAAAPPADVAAPVAMAPRPARAALRDIFASPGPPLSAPTAPPPAPEPAPSAATPSTVAPPAPLPAPPSLRLGGTITGNGRPLAIINGRFVRDGATIDGLVVVSISADRVTLAGDGRLFSLTQIGGVIELVP